MAESKGGINKNVCTNTVEIKNFYVHLQAVKNNLYRQRSMYLYGASGHAKVIIDLLRASNVAIDALYDDNPCVQQLLGYKVLPTENIAGPLIISIGDNATRKRLAERLNVPFATAVHPTAIVSSLATIGQGTVIMAGAILQACAVIGNHCIVNTGAVVEHDCKVDNFVHIAPHSTLCGNVTVGECSWVGAATVVKQGVTIGRNCLIGAGSVVVADIPDNAVAYGNPCRVKRLSIVKNMQQNLINGGGR